MLFPILMQYRRCLILEKITLPPCKRVTLAGFGFVGRSWFLQPCLPLAHDVYRGVRDRKRTLTGFNLLYNCVFYKRVTLTGIGFVGQLCFLQMFHPYRVWFRWPIMVSTIVSPARPRCLSGRPGSKANPYRVTFRRPPRNTPPIAIGAATRTFALINKNRPNPSP